jgi:hypothetical protein
MLSRKLPLLNAVIAALALAGALMAFAPKLPRPMADVSIDLPGAKRIRLIDTKTKGRIVALLASTCDHCVDTVVYLTKLERQYRAKGVQIYGALVDEEGPQQLPKFVARTKPSFSIGTLSQDNTRRLADLAINDHPYVPMLLFVDSNNMVRFQLHGDDAALGANAEKNVANMLDTLLKGK